MELGSYTQKKRGKQSPKKKTAKKKDNIVEYTTEKERIKESIQLLLKRKLEKVQQKNVNRLYRGTATKQYAVAVPEPPKKKRSSVKKKKKIAKLSKPNYESSGGERSGNGDLIDLYTPFENLMSNYKVS